MHEVLEIVARGGGSPALTEQVMRAMQRALKAERERCATLAESMGGRVRTPIVREVAVAIRRLED